MERKTTSVHREKSLFQQQIVLKLRQLRLEQGYSQPKVAEVLDVTNGRIGNIERSNQPHKYTLFQISRLCREFNCSISELFTGDPNCTNDALVDAIVKYETEK